MANYNTFLVVDVKTRKPILNTSSAKKAYHLLKTGIRVEVWNNNAKIEVIYESDKRREKNPLAPYIKIEREYIRKKQEYATMRNQRRKNKKV